MHSNKEKARDLSGINVLISQKFHYFGSQALALPEKLFDLKVGRYYKNKFSPEVASRFVQFINEHPHGIIACPSKWSRNDNSWLLGKSSSFGQTPADQHPSDQPFKHPDIHSTTSMNLDEMIKSIQVDQVTFGDNLHYPISADLLHIQVDQIWTAGSSQSFNS